MNTSFLYYAPLLLLLFILVDYVRTYLKQGLRSIPGPFWARLSGLYRVGMVRRGDAPRQYRDLHQRYGKIVRVGPNHVSVSDPAMIPIIYGISSKFMKVSVNQFEQ